MLTSPVLRRDRIQQFFKDRKVLVVDSNSISRKSTLRLLAELGVPGPQLLAATNLGDAKEELKSKKPSVLFVEYFLKDQCGLDLVKDLRNLYPNPSHTLVVALSGRKLDYVKSHLIHLEGDGLIEKPFTIDSFQNAVFDLIQAKLERTYIRQMIDQAKAALTRHQLSEAERLFKQILEGKKEIAEVSYYLGLIHMQTGQATKAKDYFLQALSVNPTHYHSMHGLLDWEVAQGNWEAAYTQLKKVLEHYPLNLQRLPLFIEISLKTSHDEDLFLYYDIYEQLEQRTEDLDETLAQSLFEAGRRFFDLGRDDLALDAYRKTEVVSQSSQAVLKKIICDLVSRGLRKEAEGMISRASPDLFESLEYRIAEMNELLIQGDEEDALSAAILLIRAGVEDKKVYETAIQISVKHSRKYYTIEDLLQRASAAFPDQIEHFESLANLGNN